MPLNSKLPQEIPVKAYHEVLLKYDFPACLSCEEEDANIQVLFGHDSKAVDDLINSHLKQIHPQITSLWCPNVLWELFVITYFFNDLDFREYVKKLGCTPSDSAGGIELPYLDERIVSALGNSANSMREVHSIFRLVDSSPKLCHYFLKINDAFLNFILQFECEKLNEKTFWEVSLKDLTVASLIDALPKTLEKWKGAGFPFACSSSVKEMLCFLKIFSDKQGLELIQAVIRLEWEAREANQHLVFRGACREKLKFADQKIFNVLFCPFTCERDNDRCFLIGNTKKSYALSYATTFFGGVFFSIDACAAYYSQLEDSNAVFHALMLPKRSLYPQNRSLFAVSALSPLAEMLSDGELFHCHTKIAISDPAIFKLQRCPGFYAKANYHLVDYTRFLMMKEIDPQILGAKLLRIVADNGIILIWKGILQPIESTAVMNSFLEEHRMVAEKLLQQP